MSIYVGESRGELLAWLNDLLDAHAPKKIEECGKGYTYCQVVDSIFGDLPMSKVKFNARMDYEYLDNFKVLQKAFKTHGIDKPIPVEKLVKCKMQDNLEFMQWLKKYWDMHSRGEGYDASGRSGGFAPPAPAPSSSRNVSSARTAAARAPVGGAGPRTVSAASNSQLQELRGQLAEMQAHCEALEKERDFYYSKLRNIELIVQERSTVEEVGEDEKVVLGKLQDILYQTEDGFELPENALEDEVQALQLEDEETF